jgi:hypothetical protein
LKIYVLTGSRSTYFKDKFVVPGEPIQVQDEDIEEFEKVFKDRIALKKKKVEVITNLRNSKETYDPDDPGTIPAHLDTTENETIDEKEDPPPETDNKDSPDETIDEVDTEDDVADIENETDEDSLDDDFDPGVDDDTEDSKKGTGKPGKGKGKGDKGKK